MNTDYVVIGFFVIVLGLALYLFIKGRKNKIENDIGLNFKELDKRLSDLSLPSTPPQPPQPVKEQGLDNNILKEMLEELKQIRAELKPKGRGRPKKS